MRCARLRERRSATYVRTGRALALLHVGRGSQSGIARVGGVHHDVGDAYVQLRGIFVLRSEREEGIESMRDSSGSRGIRSKDSYVLDENIVDVSQRHHYLFPRCEHLAVTLTLVPLAVEKSNGFFRLVVGRYVMAFVNEHVLVAGKNDRGRVVRRTVAVVMDRISQITAVRLQLAAVIVLGEGVIRYPVRAHLVAEGFEQLNAIAADRSNLGYLILDVAEQTYLRFRLHRYDFVTFERRRDLISEEIRAATLGSYAEAEARYALVDGARFRVERSLRADALRSFYHQNSVRLGYNEADDVQGFAGVSARVLWLYIGTR